MVIRFLEFFVISLLVLAAIALIIPIVYAIVKKKWAVIVVEAALLLLISIGCWVFPTRFPYMDGWILGKDRETVVALYGEPDGYDEKHMIAYDLGPDRGFLGVMSSGSHNYYYIYFDGDGKACRILKGGPIGG